MMQSHDFNLIRDIDKTVEDFNKNLPEPTSEVGICITIPAKNESKFILDTLNALADQKDENGVTVNYNIFEILLLCHNCSDDTYEKAIQFKHEHPDIQLHVLELNSATINNIGAARRVLMHLATQRLLHADGWIVSTDADTIPSSQWLQTILLQPNFTDMVCGKINVNTSQLSEEVKRRLFAKQKYNLLMTQLECTIVDDHRDPWPRHNHHSGPNMGLRKHVYLSVEGIPPISFLEDIALYNRVRCAGYNIRHLNELEVTTSGRLHSKTDSGLGSELRAWTKSNDKYQVEGVEGLVARFNIKKLIKQLFHKYNASLLDKIASLSFISQQEIIAIHKSSEIYEQMIFQVEQILEDNASWKLTYPIKDILQVNIELKENLHYTHAKSSAIE